MTDNVLMTAQERDEAQKRCEQATPGEWIAEKKWCDHQLHATIEGAKQKVGTFLFSNDLEFAVDAHKNYPRALSDLAVLHSLVGELVETVDAVNEAADMGDDDAVNRLLPNMNAALARARVIQGGESA